MTLRPAPAWRTAAWLNTPEPLTLERLRGKVVLLHAFQMLCPGCVTRGIPQAQRVSEVFAGAPLVVVGLHTVFEHHEAMKIESLRAFLRAHVTAEHLVERVLPHVPYRQWTLSFAHRVRRVLLEDVGLLSDVLTLFLRAVFALPRTSWEGGLGRRVSQGAARLLHPPGVLLGRPLQRPSSAPALQPSPSTWPLSRLYA
ncbi:thioredoxin domain-containing protein [Archangium lipolyticum]|uniref:hypothetical protein n=1 Tax=Archangium lipolyticum TaxID=2970465 RepID=UPI00214A8A79|nr:hypothetical protein [Archangium lipolyticum]